nr:hypothetical protein [Tanacetum cinerariifolium]
SVLGSVLGFIDAGESDSEEIENFLNDDSIPIGVENSPFNIEEDILFLERLLSEDPCPNLPMIPNQTKLSIKEPEHSFSMGTDDVLPPGVENEDSDEEVDAVEELQSEDTIFDPGISA